MNQTLTANWGQNELHNNNQNQLCYPFNKNLSFIKLKEVLNCKVHNLRNTATYFDRFLYAVIYCMSMSTVFRNDGSKENSPTQCGKHIVSFEKPRIDILQITLHSFHFHFYLFRHGSPVSPWELLFRGPWQYIYK